MTAIKILQEITEMLAQKKIDVSAKDTSKPWGGFLVINESCTQEFISAFFPEIKKEELGNGKLSPKILLVAPRKKLSWQYHHRREEIWKLIEGVSALVRSETDVEGDLLPMKKGEAVFLKRNERHRLVGLEDWGVVAEIWKHTDPSFPSDEHDIIRLQDDFGRN